MHHVDEMKLAAELVKHEHFMGNCAGGFPLIAFEDECRFCGATHNDRCQRVIVEPARTHQ